jgi:glycosyltransferase involved in cell wall biosynthesis
MKKIVYIIDSLSNPGGMERVLCTKVNWLAKNNYQVTIITQSSLREDLFFDFDKSIRIESLNLKKNKNIFFNLVLNKQKREFEKKLTQSLFQLRPDITISMFGEEYDFLYKIKDGSKKIIEFHFSKNYLTHLLTHIPNLSFRTLKIGYSKYIQHKQRKSAKKYDKLVLLTKKDKLLWDNNVNVSVIPNPVSFTTEEKSLLENKQLIAIGRFIAQKGFDLLIESFVLIHKKVPDWKLIIIGEGQDENYLNHLINVNNLKDVVALYPPNKQIKEVFLNSSILAFPSRYEGFGLVLTEAMECGVPCVAFDCECGPSEIISSGEDGYLVKPFDIDMFAKSVVNLMEDENLRKRMGAKAKQNVKRFHNELIMSKWVELFNEIEN